MLTKQKSTCTDLFLRIVVDILRKEAQLCLSYYPNNNGNTRTDSKPISLETLITLVISKWLGSFLNKRQTLAIFFGRLD